MKTNELTAQKAIIISKNKRFPRIKFNQNHIDHVNDIVTYSLKNHPISNRWGEEKDSKELRTTGSLSELAVALLYNLPKPTKSFGAIGGQDHGKDFEIKFNDSTYIADIKGQRRRNGKFYDFFACNISTEQLLRKNSLTTHYFFINIHNEGQDTFASFLGFISKEKILNSVVGDYIGDNAEMTRSDGGTTGFDYGHYQTYIKYLDPVPFSDEIRDNLLLREGLKITWHDVVFRK